MRDSSPNHCASAGTAPERITGLGYSIMESQRYGVSSTPLLKKKVVPNSRALIA